MRSCVLRPTGAIPRKRYFARTNRARVGTLVTKSEGNCYKTLSARARNCGLVLQLVAVPAQCDQVSLRVVTEGASPSHMMNVQIPERSAFFAAPTIAFEDRATQHRIRDGRYSDSRPLSQDGSLISLFLQDPKAHTLRLSNRWMLSILDLVWNSPFPRQRQQENRRKSFRANSLGICHSQA